MSIKTQRCKNILRQYKSHGLKSTCTRIQYFNIFDHLADSKMLFLIVSLLVLSFVVAETITEVSDII